MKTKRRIEVTQEDLKSGVSNDPARCPIALAVARAFPEAQRVSVTGGGVDLDMGEGVWTYRLPPNAANLFVAIAAAERGAVGMDAFIAPAEFTLARPIRSAVPVASESNVPDGCRVEHDDNGEESYVVDDEAKYRAWWRRQPWFAGQRALAQFAQRAPCVEGVREGIDMVLFGRCVRVWPAWENEP
jgi:hypothetical protein